VEEPDPCGMLARARESGEEGGISGLSARKRRARFPFGRTRTTSLRIGILGGLGGDVKL